MTASPNSTPPPITDELVATITDGVLVLRFNRPASRNALSLPMLEAMSAMLDYASQDDAVRVIVVTGTGSSFCAGGDVKAFSRGASIFGPATDHAKRAAQHAAVQQRTSVRLAQSQKPTVALVNGHAVGAGLAFMLACDLRYVAASAALRTGFSPIGLAGDFGCTWLLNDIVGPARTRELLLLSEPISAFRAQELGLATVVVEDRSLVATGMAAAQLLAERSPLALKAIKSNIARARVEDLASCADAEVDWHIRLVDTPEHIAAAASFASRARDRKRDEEQGTAG